MLWRIGTIFSRQSVFFGSVILLGNGVFYGKQQQKHTAKKSTLPLAGINVIDFGHKFAGKGTGLALSDLGATVVSVSKPGAPTFPYDATLDRGKKCITLDLTDDADLDTARQLVASSDVVIEDFRPGVMDKLGLNFEQLCAKYPRLVTISLPPFSKTDHEMRDRKATEATLATHSGVFSQMGPNRTLMGVEPSYSPLPLASAYGAVIAAAATVLALQSREKTGVGDCIEVPLGSALLEGLILYNQTQINPKPRRYMNLREQEIQRRTANKIPFDLTYDELFSSRYMDPFFRNYRCKDGRYYYVVSIAHKAHAKRVMQALGVHDEVMRRIEAMGSYPIDDVYLEKSQWGKAGSFETYPVSPEWSMMINELLEPAFLQKEAFEWEKILADVGAVGGVQRSLEEWMLHTEHTRDAELFVNVENDPLFGDAIQPGPIAWLEGRVVEPKPRQFVTPEEALSSLPVQQAYVEQGERTQAWLKGVKVLDLCNVIAGPHSAGIMARFGAEVIKVDPVVPNFGPSYITYAFNSGQSKRSMQVDIRSEQGYEVLKRLISSSDIIVFNATAKQIGRLKLDEESIKQINPKAIFCQLDLYGGQGMGAMSNYPGYDDVAQAVSGISERFGGGLNTPEEHAHLGTLDVMCGFAAVLAIAAALLHRHKTEEALRARTSLASMSGFLQIPYAYHYKDRTPRSEPSGRDIKGQHELSRFYRCKDDWIFVDSNIQELDKLENIFPGLRAIVNKERCLEHAFAQEDADVWLQRFIDQDIAVARRRTMDDLREQYTTLPDGTAKNNKGTYSFTKWPKEIHPSGLDVTLGDPCAVRTAYASIFGLTPTQKIGASTDNILEELGYSKNEMARLHDEKAVGSCWSEQYFPR